MSDPDADQREQDVGDEMADVYERTPRGGAMPGPDGGTGMTTEPDDLDEYGQPHRPLHHFNVAATVVGLVWRRDEAEARRDWRRAVERLIAHSGFDLLDGQPGDVFHSETCDCGNTYEEASDAD